MAVPPEMPQAEADHGPLRRMPSQQRSRERVERMLSCAAELIGAQGSDAMRMSEVAQLAGVSIGSLYQYFPDKSAIIRTLAERYNVEARQCIEEGLADVGTLDELCDAFAKLLDIYYDLFIAEPLIRDIRTATLADKTLQDMELEESRVNGAFLARTLQRVRPEADAGALAMSAFLVMHLSEATMRLAISLERAEGDAVVAAFKQLALAEFRRDH